MQSSWLNRNHSQPTVLPRRPCLGSATLLRARQASARPVFAAAKPTQAADFRSLSAADIDKEVEQSKVELFKLRLQQSRREVGACPTLQLSRDLSVFARSADKQG